MKLFSLVSLALLNFVSPAFAGCPELTKNGSYTLTRSDPHFEITNTVSKDGTVVQKSIVQKNGVTERVTTVYWNGVIAVDRKSNLNHVQLKLPESAKTVDLAVPGKTYSFPMSILVDGNEVDTGSFIIMTTEMGTLELGSCNYPVMAVRTSMERNNGSTINEQALFSLEAGMLLGNIAMTPEWKARSGVFFDKIKAN